MNIEATNKIGKTLIIVLKILNVLLLVPFSSNINETTLILNKITVVIKGIPNGTRKKLFGLSEIIDMNT